MNLLEAAMAWHNGLFSVIPIRSDGTKKPLIEWRRYMTEHCTNHDLQQWYNPSSAAGIGIVCGEISRNLEMLELEGRAATSEHFDKIYRECDLRNISWLLDTLTQNGYCESTPSGGFHLLYRISDHAVPGNTKVARRPATEEEIAEDRIIEDSNRAAEGKPPISDEEWNKRRHVRVLSETRGEGGYVIVAPTAGTVHPSGASWDVIAGTLGSVPTISWDERCRLHEAIHAALDEMPAPVLPEPVRRVLPFQRAGLSPGDDFEQKTDWIDILGPHGWTVSEVRGSETFWVRPGKQARRGEHSATTGYSATGDRLYVFSTSTEFDAEKPYNKFAAYTILEHRGDFGAAARELARRGYGTRTPQPGAVVPAPATPDVRTPVEPVVQQAAEIAVPDTAVIRDRQGLPVYADDVFHAPVWDEPGTVRLYTDLFADTFRYLPHEDKWLMWSGTHWGEDKAARSELAAFQLTSRMLDYAKGVKKENPELGNVLLKYANKATGMMKMVSLTRAARIQPEIVATADQLDRQRHLVSLDNGTLDLRTGKLQPSNPEDLLTRKMNTFFDDTAGEGRWGRFMEEVLPDPQVRDYFQRAIGYMATGEADKRVLFVLNGETGTGKTQVLEAIRTVMGDFGAVAAASTFKPRAETNHGPTDALHKLRGKRFVVQSEFDQGAQLNESLVKSVTGGDTQSTRPLYGKEVEWRPEYVMFLATNYLPRISSSDNAIWSRVKPIRFTQRFVDAHGMPLRPEDAGLGAKLAESEPHIILNWILEGIRKYRERGLAEPEAISDWTQEYRDEVDTARQFLTEAAEEGRITVAEGAQVSVRDLYRVYVAWTQDNFIKPVASRTFVQRLESSGWERKRSNRGIMWQGIGVTGYMIESQTAAGRGNWPPMRM